MGKANASVQQLRQELDGIDERKRASTVQCTLIASKDKANEMEGLERPEYTTDDFTHLDPEEVQTDAIKDYNWLYVEYYGQTERFEGLLQKLHKMGAMRTKRHELDPEWFARAVKLMEAQEAHNGA